MKARQPTSGPSRVRLRHLYRFMSSRDFVAGRHELVALGFTPRQVDNWVRGGRLVRIFRSTYSYGRNPETRRALWRAALLVAGPGSALTGRSACEGWGFVEGRPGLPRTIEVASTSGQARSFRGCSPGLRRTVVQVAHRSFGVDDVRTDGGLVLVQPSLALIDFAAEATDREVRFAFLDACRTGNLTEKDLALSFERMVHRRGARKLRPYLELWRPELRRTKSVFEAGTSSSGSSADIVRCRR